MKYQDGSINHELLSALADGELQGEELARLLAAIPGSQDAISSWHAYHVVGDVLRCGDLGDCSADAVFVRRLRSKIGSLPDGYGTDPGPTMDLLRPQPGSAAAAGELTPTPGPVRRAANDPSIRRWKLLAGFASAVAVGALGWSVAGLDGAMAPSARLAQLQVDPQPQTADAGMQAAVKAPPVMLRDARLDELLAAHRQFGGVSALQMPSGFLRNATFETAQP